MKKYIGKIITGVIAVVLAAVATIEYFIWQNDKSYFDAQLNEYETAISSLTESFNGTMSNLNGANSSIADFKNQIAQMQADLEAYEKAIADINTEREAKNKALEDKKKEEEEEWNALSENQQIAILEGRERSKITSYLLKNSEEYAELYIWMRELADKGLVELKNSEYKEYKQKKTRMNELEAECKAMLEKANNSSETVSIE